MNPAPIVVSLAEQPAYYALYALYVDYRVNQRRDAEREYFARLREVVTYIQPLIGKKLPYMKSWSLRLFTEREALNCFSLEQVGTAWELVRNVVDQIGPPSNWTQPAHSVRSWRRQFRKPAHPSTAPEQGLFEPALQRVSPIDYRLVV